MKIFFGDIVHTWNKKGFWTSPLNIGYVSSYSNKMLKDDGIEISFKLFKNPQLLLDAIRDEKPNIVALSHYVWNAEINRVIFDYTKSILPDCLTVGGGPQFTNHNYNESEAKKFFYKNNNLDFYILNQGEKGFYQLAKKFYESNLRINDLKEQKNPGMLTNDLKNNNNIYIGEDIGPLNDLNEIPSPYLTGLLDSFFEGFYVPIIETNRSCPYRCTFCAWGIGTQKLLRFNEDRVKEEIQYIAKRTKHTGSLYIADANFSILERDVDFAREIYKQHVQVGYPNFVIVQWNKTRPDRVARVAKEFKQITQVGASMQSFDEDVLKAIKRKNLSLDQINGLINDLKQFSAQENTFSELIIGLPNETKESHLDANRKLIDMGFEINNYNLHLLPGTEMSGKESRDKYFKKTGWRLYDNGYGIYNNQLVIEGEEVVTETKTLSVDDFKYFRFFHFLQQMMWGKKWYYEYLIFLKRNNIHPVDVINEIINQCKQDKNNAMHIVYNNFIWDYTEAESFSTFNELKNFWSKPHNLERLRNGEYGKLNSLYTFEVGFKR
ncbi:radical SAM protein [Candidatus Pelagibacter bacterium]|nr:radical SAM protein [Candidatus Pelagibacter bacterium]